MHNPLSEGRLTVGDGFRIGFGVGFWVFAWSAFLWTIALALASATGILHA